MFLSLDWRRPDAGCGYQIRWYPERDYGEIAPRPEPGDIAGFYDVEGYYTHNAAGRVGEAALDLFGRFLRRLAWQFDYGIEPDQNWWRETLGERRLSVLDIGAGGGNQLMGLAKLGHQVVGVEPDDRAVSNSRAHEFRVYQGTAEELPAELCGSTYDVVIFMHVLEHCLDPERAISNARDLLSTGGICIAEVPNNSCRGLDFFGNAWFFLDVPRHLNFFTEHSLAAAFERNGFVVTDRQYRGYTRHFNSDWRNVQRRIARLMSIDSEWRFGTPGYLRYLLGSVFSAKWRKYDSVRVICRAN